ncbi:hypothetical protein ATN79_21835 [Paraburkholderia caribensis]|nr:hypothetical protein ATN79_21835 [Paraburkholderia caribensis]
MDALGRARAISLSCGLSPYVKRKQIEKDDMTYAMWGIAVGLALMFGVSLRRYRHSLLRKREIRWMDEHHLLDRLREQLGLSLQR